jgi:hypothetical protein
MPMLNEDTKLSFISDTVAELNSMGFDNILC